MSKAAFERQLAEVEALRAAPDPVPALRRALGQRNNFLVSRAAAIAAARQLGDLIPDLIAAFERFLTDPVKSDPQCWAKNAIVKALKDLGHTGAAVFLRGIRHVQMEPVWGGRQDTATTLRGACAHALVACRLAALEILTPLTELLEDPEMPVRLDAARAMAQLGAPEGVLPLRLKALAGDREPEVVGQCLAALIAIAPHDGLAFAARFLDNPAREIQVEAAAALAGSHEPEALAPLKEFWQRRTDAEVRRILVDLLGSSPLTEAAAFLVGVVRDSSTAAAVQAVAALGASRHRERVRDELAAIVADRGDAALAAQFRESFGALA